MTPAFPHTRLGDILQPVKEVADIQPDAEYKQITVRLNHNGVVLRGLARGVTIGSKQYLASAGQFIVSKIDARNGAFGLVPSELDGAVVTGDFPLFSLKNHKIEPKFLDYYSATLDFVANCLKASEGTTNRMRLKINKFMELKIPLPPLDEQCRIVARIEHLVAKIEKAKKHRHEIFSRYLALEKAYVYELSKDVPMKLMSEVAPLVRRPVEVAPEVAYRELGVRSFGKGTFHKPAISGINLGNKRIFEIHPGDLVFSNVFAWEGAIAVAREEDRGRVGSHRFITCVPENNVVTANFLRSFFLTEEGLFKIGEASPGGAGRNRTLGLRKLEKIRVPVPPYERQLKFDDMCRRIRTCEKLSDKQITQLNALLPSILDKAFRGELNIVETESGSGKVVPIRGKNTASEAFQEAVLIARLVRDFASDGYLLSRKRYTKLAYLFHRTSKDDVKRWYLKKAAGPYGPWTKYQGPEKIALTNQYIQKGKKQKYGGFKPGPEIDQIDRYFTTYWDESNIAWLIERFKYKSTDNLEVIATVDMAMLDLVDQGRVVSLNTVKDVIASEPEWFPKLSRKIFSDTAIVEAIRELQGWFIYD